MKNNLLEELQELKIKKEKLLKTLERLIDECPTEGTDETYSRRLCRHITNEELSALRSRNLYLHLPEMAIEDEHDIHTPELCDHLASEFNFSMDLKDNSIWVIKMPMLPNKQGKCKSKWVAQTIGPLVRNAYYKKVRKTQKYPERSEHATIVIIHHYDVSSSVRNLIDTDNYDIKTFIDCLSPYVISSDSIHHLDIYQKGQEGSAFYTEAVIMPTEHFGQWLRHRN